MRATVPPSPFQILGTNTNESADDTNTHTRQRKHNAKQHKYIIASNGRQPRGNPRSGRGNESTNIRQDSRKHTGFRHYVLLLSLKFQFHKPYNGRNDKKQYSTSNKDKTYIRLKKTENKWNKYIIIKRTKVSNKIRHG